ncbi:MAG: tetratricopeptide repeat protein [Deltaproteobacteria bacterium]|nr:tetratricopeptide repeat protein [Deltaproteobacteria bacterium]
MGPTRPLISKIAPPELPKVVWRDALFETLDRKAHYAVTWISGMAGAGKTTLVASYLAGRKLPYIWYRVDGGDCDLPTFFHYVGMAVKKATPRKRKPLPPLTPDYLPGLDIFAGRFFDNLIARLSQPIFIVFDDFHKVASCTELHRLLKEGFLKLPRHIHVLIASRLDPPSAFASLLANNRMRIIDSNRLRLNLEETRAILRLETGRPISLCMSRKCHKQSEGWAAGLVLIAKGMPHDKRLPGSRQLVIPSVVFDYFSSELFDKMEEAVKSFLLQTAFLPRMTVAMAKVLSGRSDAGHMLAMLQHSNRFTEKASDDPVSYQYHALFRQFLIAKALAVMGENTVLKTKHHAAKVLAEAGWVEDAAWMFIEIDDMAGLERLIRNSAMTLIGQGRHMTLEKWLGRIPADRLAVHPWLLYWWGVAGQYRAPHEARARFIAALKAFTSLSDERGLWLAWAGIVESIVNEWHDFSALDPWIGWLEDRTRSGAAYPSLQIEARVAVAMTVALLIRKPEPDAISPWAQRALVLARKGDDIDFHLQAIGWVMTYEAWMGRFDTVAVIRKESRALAKSLRAHPPMMIHWRWIDLSTRLCTMTGKDSILSEVADAIALVHKTGLYAWEHKFFMPGIFAALLLSDFQTADAYLKRFEAVLDQAPYHGHTIYHHFAGLYQLLSGNILQARAHAESALRLAEETGYVLACVICRIQLAYVRHLQGDADAAREILEPAYAVARRTDSTVLTFMCLMVFAKIAYDKKDSHQGLVFLKKALVLGRQNCFLTMVWWWHPGMVAYLCAQALVNGIETDYVKALIHTHHLAPDPAFVDLQDWPRALEVRTLGTFQMRRNGMPVQFKGKIQKRPMELLKFLMAQGGRDIPIDRITDALWPDADGDMAASAFSSTLNRLRKLIGINAAVMLSNGRVSLDSRYVWVDAHVFEAAARRAFTRVGDTADREMLEACEKVIGSYHGDFLDDENGTPWIIAARERLKNLLLDVLKTAGRYREAAGDWDKAMAWYQKGLSIDPLEEHFYQRLMACYYRQGRYAEAARVYGRCREVLKNHFDVPPAKATEDLYRRIRHVDTPRARSLDLV